MGTKFTIGGEDFDLPKINLKAQRVVLREMPAVLADWQTSGQPDALFGVFLKIFAVRSLSVPEVLTALQGYQTAALANGAPHSLPGGLGEDARVAQIADFVETTLEGQAESTAFFETCFQWLTDSGFALGELMAPGAGEPEQPTLTPTPTSTESSAPSFDAEPKEAPGI